MNLKILPMMLSFIGLATGTVNFRAKDDAYKVNDLIWIKNLHFHDAKEMGIEDGSKVISFDIVFHTTTLPYDIEAHIRETENNTIQPPTFKLDSRQGMVYQGVQLVLGSSFVSRISKNETLKVKYGDLTLFAFQSPELLQPLNVFEYEKIEELPENLLFKYEVKLPRIIYGELEYSYFEYVDLSKIDFKAMQNYYYGKFPDQYLWASFHSDLYDNNETMETYKSKMSGYDLYLNAFFYEINLFKDYYRLDSSLRDKPFVDTFEFGSSANGYYHLDYVNSYKRVTFKDGIMRIKNELSDDVLKTKENKSSKFVTYPLDVENFKNYFEMAKNMEISLELTAGIFGNFKFRLRYINNLKEDYFYNHLTETTITGTHNNQDLVTVDRMYA